MPRTTINHPERLFPADPGVRRIASDLYQTVRDLPIVSPHGHTDPAWFALDERFPDAFDLRGFRVEKLSQEEGLREPRADEGLQ